jgi:tryptophan synthase alpha chain
VTQRIDRCFDAAAQNGRTVLIPFITAGDPEPGWTVSLMHCLVEAGADLIELGIPFSDPMADGPVIQASSERAVSKGVTLSNVLEWVREFRLKDSSTPVVLMGYLNPFERIGYSNLGAQTADAGVDGLLLVDCPPEEMPDLQNSLDDHHVYSIRLVAPTTTDDRITFITTNAKGFIYYVSFKGTTGAGRLDALTLKEPIERIRTTTSLPVAVGFGIRDAGSASAVAANADAVVIGSALVERLADCRSLEQASLCARDFLSPIRQALDKGRGVQ